MEIDPVTTTYEDKAVDSSQSGSDGSEDTEDFVAEPNFGSKADLPRASIKKPSPPQMANQNGRLMKKKTSKELQRLRSELIEDSINDEESEDYSP